MSAAAVHELELRRAKTLLDEPHSCVTKVTRTEKIKLPMCYIGSVANGVRLALNGQIKRYSDRLDGVVMAYENVVIGCRSVECFADQTVLLFDVDVDFLVFTPRVGNTLSGVVNKLSREHIGCLVHECFNVSLSKKDVAANVDAVRLGARVLFEVSFVDLQSRIIFMRGTLLELLNGPAADAEDLLEEGVRGQDSLECSTMSASSAQDGDTSSELSSSICENSKRKRGSDSAVSKSLAKTKKKKKNLPTKRKGVKRDRDDDSGETKHKFKSKRAKMEVDVDGLDGGFGKSLLDEGLQVESVGQDEDDDSGRGSAEKPSRSSRKEKKNKKPKSKSKLKKGKKVNNDVDKAHVKKKKKSKMKGAKKGLKDHEKRFMRLLSGK